MMMATYKSGIVIGTINFTVYNIEWELLARTEE